MKWEKEKSEVRDLPSAKKIILIVFAIVLVFIAILLFVQPPQLSKLSVSETVLVDNNGYPSVKIVFEAKKYPIVFKLFTSEGELVDTRIVGEGEKITYLSLVGINPKKNMVSQKSFTVKAYYGNEEVYSASLQVNGVKPKLTWAENPVTGEASILGLSIKTIRFKVKNEGDVPLYIDTLSPDFKVYFKDEAVPATVDDIVVTPGGEALVEAKPLIILYELTSTNSIKIRVVDSELKYDIQPPSPRVEILSLGTKPLFGNIVSLENLTVKIENTWNLPINAGWAEISINGEKTGNYLDFEIKPGETVNVTHNLILLSSEEGKVVMVEYKLGSTIVPKSFVVP
jgi:hypothetical protein